MGDWAYYEAQVEDIANGYRELAQSGKDFLAGLNVDTRDEDDQAIEKGKRMLKTTGTDGFTGTKRLRMLIMYDDISTRSMFVYLD